MNEGAKNTWFSKLTKNLNERRQEVGAVTYATEVKDAFVDVGRQVKNRAGEIGVGIQGEATTVGHQLDTLATQVTTGANRVQDNLQDMHQNLGEVAKSVGSDLLDTHVFTEKSGTQTGVREKAQLLVARNANKLGTIIEDRLIPWLKRRDNTAGDPEEIKAELQAENQASQSTPEATDKTAEVVEGQSLLDVVAGNLKAAVAFDQMKDKELGAVIEKIMAGNEVVVKLGRVVFRQVVAVLLEQSRIGGRTARAIDAMDELRRDQTVSAQLEQINGMQLLNTFDQALRTISEMRQQSMEARGANQNLSFKYEAGLIENSEKAQREMAALGQEIRQMLPENGERLTANLLATARGKGFEYSRKANEAMRNLKHVALSLEIRFPGQVNEIRAKLQEIVNDWKDAKAVIPTITGEMFSAELAANCKRTIDWEFIAQDPSLRSLNGLAEGSADMQRQALAEVGIKFVDVQGGGGSPYEVIPGSMYSDAIETFTQYTALVKAYEVAREQVAEHPEAADRFFVLAERVVQMRYAFEDIRTKITAELAIQVDRAKNVAEIKKLQKENRTAEADARQERADYQRMVLERFKARWNQELPVIKKTLTYATALGVSAAVIIGAHQYIEQIQQASSQADVIMNAANTQIDILRNANSVQIAQLVQHMMAEIADKFAALNAAVEPIQAAAEASKELVMEAGKAAGLAQVKEVVVKAAPWIAGLGITRVFTGWLQKAGNKLADSHSNGQPREAKPALIEEVSEPISEAERARLLKVRKLKKNYVRLMQMEDMDEAKAAIREQVEALGSEIKDDTVEAEAEEELPTDSASTNRPAAA